MTADDGLVPAAAAHRTPHAPATGGRAADEIWASMTALVMDSRGDWRRRAVETAGMPFSRVRVLRRLARGPMTLRELAEATTMDAPATTVAINDLESRGLVVRQTDAVSRRSKNVSLTPEGRRIVRKVDRIRDVAPPGLQSLDADELQLLGAVLTRIRDTKD